MIRVEFDAAAGIAFGGFAIFGILDFFPTARVRHSQFVDQRHIERIEGGSLAKL